MFAKPHKTSGSSLLKGKDAKKLRRDVRARFPSVPEEALHALLAGTSKGGALKKLAFQAPSRCVLYVSEASQEPLLFDVSGKGDYCFTVYSLWQSTPLPSTCTSTSSSSPSPSPLLPPLVVHAPVSEFVLRGADVMLPGVVFTSVEELQALRKGELRAVYARGNPHAIAVGEMLVDGDDVARAGRDRQGRALRVLHVFGDELWLMGPRTVPNAGFPTEVNANGKRVVQALQMEAAGHGDGDGDEGGDGVVDEQAVGDVGVELGDVTLEEKPGHEEAVVTRQEMDALYYGALLQALRSGRLKDKHLPLLASTFHANVLLPSRPEGITLNIKQSSHKKLSAFLNAMARVGLVAVKEKDGVQSITGISARHPDVLSHSLYRCQEEASAADAAAAASAANQGSAVPPPAGSFAPDVQERLGLSPALRTLFSSDQSHASTLFADVLQRDKDSRTKHFTPVEIRDWIVRYIDAEALVDTGDKKFVRLNAPLTDALFGKHAPPGGRYPARMARPDLLSMLLQKCPNYHRVCLYPGHAPKMKGGALRKLEISADKSKKHASSTVTTLAYYQAFGIDGDAFAKEAQKKWGSSATTQPTVDKQRGDEIKIQGQLVNEVLQYLETKYQINTTKYCEVRYGKNVKLIKKKN